MASPIEIANAYVALRVKMPGVTRDITTALGGAAGAGESAGRSIGDRLVSSATKVVKAGAATIGGVLAAGVGTALVKGFQRLDAIDVARKKLTGLGNDAGAVDTIMQNALASVKGTSFGLGDAATVAAQAVAAGIKPGKDLEGVLKTVANTAAAAGTDLGDMGSIFAKAMSQANGVQNDVLAQVADKGIPIYQALADQLGVTSGEVFKLASEGKVNFEQFAAAAKAAAGTVAQEMGTTVGGSWKNLIASLGRSGAGLLSGIFPQIAPSLQAITVALTPLEGMAGALGDKIGKFLAPAFEGFVGLLQNGIDLSPFAQLWSTLSPVGILFSAIQPILPVVGQAFADIASAIGGALVPVLPSLVSLMQAVTPLLTTALVAALPVVVALVEALSGAVSALAPFLIDVVRNVVDFVSANTELVAGLGIAAGAVWAVVGAVSLFKSVQLGLTAATYGAQGAMIVAGTAAKVYSVAMGILTGASNAQALAAKASSVATAISAGAQRAAASATALWTGTVKAANVAVWLMKPAHMAAAAGMIAQKVATLAVSGATKAAAAAQWAFNAAMSANPIGLIIAAIVALVAAVVWFFTQTELGKQIWQEFTNFLGEAWTNICGFFTAAWENVIQPVFQKIGEIATWLYENVLKPVFDGIGVVVGWIAGFFKLQFDLIVNAFRLVGAIANWLWVNAIQPAFTGIGIIFDWLWKNAIKPVFDFISAGFQGIGIIANWLWLNVIQPAFNGIGAIFNWLWTYAVLPVVNFIRGAIQNLGTVFNWLYVNIVRPVFDGISSTMSTVWQWIDKNVFTPFKTGIDLIAKGFEVAKSAIETTWNGIKKAAAVPINFVLETVWNNGLRSFWNDMVSELGLDDMKLPKAGLVKFASGGVLPGYTPGRDVHMFTSPTGGRLALSGGEAIMRPEFTRAVGGKAGVDALNKRARNGTLAFANGGVWDELGNFGADVARNVGGVVSMIGDFMADPVGMVKKHIIDGIIAPLLNQIGGGVIGKTVGQLPVMAMEGLGKLLGGKVKDKFPAGGVSGGPALARAQAMLKNFPGLHVTSTYRSPAENAAVGGAPGSYHMDAANPAVDIAGDWSQMNAFAAMARSMGGWRELLWQVAGHYDHVHVAAQGGVFGQLPKLYDQGGWLPHGGLAINKTGKPEAVLTPDESRALRSGLNSGVHIENLTVADPNEFVRVVETEKRRSLARAGVF